MNKNMNEENKKLKIVFADTGGKNFNFYIEGDTEGIADTPEDQMTPAQFYGSKLFEVCRSSLEEAGIIKSKQEKTTKH